ncbi:serine O-acetyltransferase [Sphingobium boeckii]|uniref:Serine acetyltransferase n=1 Tax=Sphingobium boeckii TaxID=1082345 RepID=A0A7W9EGE3_9SPHN|nr:serine acetyltransferase [Sphingobium boeckii]MBB5686631.1 serine O-acetyltransferase [Sphingobium boeckii]
MARLSDLFAVIGEDHRAHGGDWTRPGFRAMAVYRFGVWRMTIRNRWLRALPNFLYRAAFRFCRNIYGIELPYTAIIGRGVVIEHQGGIVVHGSTVIGDGCIIRQNCTLGIRSLDRLDDAPVLGCHVNVGAGAVILGKIHIGDGAQIGANAVVLKDVPAQWLAVGVPAAARPPRVTAPPSTVSDDI